MRGYPRHLVDHILSEVKFTERESALQQTQKTRDKPLPFVTHITHQCLININVKMALDREPTLTQGNIQGAPFHLLQKGEILKRYTCESKTLRVKVQHYHEKRELCLVCQHPFHLSKLTVRRQLVLNVNRSSLSLRFYFASAYDCLVERNEM